YWDIDQTNPSAPMFSAAASLTPVPEPATAALISVPMLFCLLAGAWTRCNRTRTTRARRPWK
ncbi:hypothetical protein, partial [Accumulibacter sp.]